MNPMKEAAKLVGWLTASLAGLGAILYACGFLIVQTQLHILGIDALLPSGREYYLQEGAGFFIVTGQKLGFLLLGLVALILVLCIPVIVVAKNERAAMYLARLKTRSLEIHQRHQWLWQAAMLLVMVALLFYPLVYDLDVFRAPLELSGLLHTAQDDATLNSRSSEAHRISQWVRAGNARSLDDLYLHLLMHCLFAALLVTASQRILSVWPLRPLIGFPFQLVFLIYVLLLPLDYGVLEKRIEFPSIRLVSTQDRVSNESGQMLLLYKTDQEFILWDQAQEKALWVAKDKVAKIEVGRTSPIFKKEGGQRWPRNLGTVVPSA